MATPTHSATEGVLAYEGVVSLAMGDSDAVELWARMYHVEPDLPVGIAATYTLLADPPEWRIHIGPERPDLPADEQPPTWPPPFPVDTSPQEPKPYCRVTVNGPDVVEYIDRLRLGEVELLHYIDKALSWRATLS